MFPFPSNPMQPGAQQATPAPQAPQAPPMPQPQWQVPPMNVQPQGPAGGPWQALTQNAAPTSAQAQPGSMPSPMEQGDALQRLLAEIRARQGQQQSPSNNARSMLGL